MSDYDPRPPGARPDPTDPLRKDPLYTPHADQVVATNRGGFYLVGGVLVALVLVAGLMFFNPGSAPGERNDQARQPDPAIEAPTPVLVPTPAPAGAPTRLPTAPPEGPIQTPPDSVTPANPQR